MNDQTQSQHQSAGARIYLVSIVTRQKGVTKLQISRPWKPPEPPEPAQPAGPSVFC